MIPAIIVAYVIAWIVTWFYPDLAIVTALAFIQNVAFTFVSRGRNSGSLVYHLIASVFSNGIWVVMFIFNVKIVSGASESLIAFCLVYVLSTLSGSVFAHWLAHRLERGKKTTQQGQQSAMDRMRVRMDRMQSRIMDLESRIGLNKE